MFYARESSNKKASANQQIRNTLHVADCLNAEIEEAL
jgi:hypothetical protein